MQNQIIRVLCPDLCSTKLYLSELKHYNGYSHTIGFSIIWSSRWSAQAHIIRTFSAPVLTLSRLS